MGNVESSKISADKILTSENDFDDSVIKEYNQNVTSYFLDRMQSHLDKKGNKDFLINCGLKYFPEQSLSTGPETVTIKDYVEKVPAFAKCLYERGLRKGNVIHIIIGTRGDIYIPVHAALYCQGVVSVSIDSIGADTLHSEVEETKAKFVICTNKTLDKVKNTSAEIINLDTELESMIKHGLSSSTKIPEQTTFNDQDLAIILWTSGTTGRPKGIQLNMVSIWRSLFFVPKEDGNNLITCNFGHVSGFSYTCYWSINFETCTLHFISPDDVSALGIEKILFTMQQIPFSVVLLASSHIMYLAEKAANNQLPYYPTYDKIKHLCPAGAHTYQTIDKDLKNLFHKLESVPNLYALTESGGLLLFSNNQRSNGGVVGNIEIYIRDIHTGERLGPNKSGELIFRNPEKPTLGYLNRPEENENFFLKDGWCCSGDLFHYSEKGEFFYEGRIKEMIKSQGSHVYPIELEHIIQSMSKDIIEAGIVTKTEGIRLMLGAVVVVKSGCSVDPEKIRSYVNSQVDDFKKLHGRIILTHDPLPRNANGKLQRSEIQLLA